ncbi:MAG: DUF1826 domain-containing protein [Pseudomonadota bacterium]
MRDTIQDAAIGVAVADSAADLQAFLRPGSAAALWRRQMPRDVQGWLADLDTDLLPRARVVLSLDGVAAALSDLCDRSALPEGPERAWLCADIEELAQTFAALMNTRYIRLRLDVVTTNACRRFHIDALTARLVCTYRGTGTQYGISPAGGEPTRVFTVQTGAPILLRGTLWPQTPPSGLLHRSPPIEGTGETRLVLVLDPVSEAEAKADAEAKAHAE